MRHLTALLFGCAVVAFGQATISPTQLKMGAPAGANWPVQDVLTVFYAGAGGPNAGFDTSVRYGGPVAGWLTATPLHGTTPARILVSADASNLAEGTYTAQVYVDIGPLHLTAVTTIGLSVGPVGGNPAGVTANPSSVVFLPDSFTTPQTIAISAAPGVQGPQTFSVFSDSTGWLAVTQLDTITPGTLRVTVNPSGLDAGTYKGAITISTEAGKSTIVPVALVVPIDQTGALPRLTPAQQALTFNYQLGKNSNPTQTVYISTASTQSTYCTATASQSWIGVASASWVTPDQSADCYAPGLFYVAVDPTGLAAGTHKGAVTVSASGMQPVEIPVTLTVSATPVLNSNPSFITIDSENGILTSNLGVTGTDSFFFSASIPGNPSWLALSPVSGVASPNEVDLTLTPKITALPAGVYNASVIISGPNGTPTLTVPVQLKVASSSASAGLPVSPSTLTFQAIAGDRPAAQVLGIGAGLPAAEDVMLSASSEGWLRVSPIEGSTPLVAQVSVDPATPPGTYSGSITATSLTTGEKAAVTVNFTSTARVLTPSPSSLLFSQAWNGAVPAPQDLQITANSPSQFQIVSQPAWIKPLPSGSLTTPAKLTVTPDTTGLTPGAYQGSIQLSGPNAVYIQVALTIAAPPPPAAAPASISFAHNLGSPAPAEQTINITNVPGPIAFTVSTSMESGASWLVVTPSSGTTPGVLTATVKTAALIPGSHAGSIVVSFPSAPSATLTIPVSLTVTGTAVQVRDVLNGAAMTPGSISPGEIVTLTGLGLGPLIPATAQPTPAGAFDTTLGGVRVWFDGAAAPLLYAQDQQINAIVPYAVQGRATTRLQVQTAAGYSIPIEVKVADTAPGIFTAAGTGRGQAAALNGDSTPNSAVNAAPRGGIVVLYITGEGQTDPPGQDGRVINSDLRHPLLPVTVSIGGQQAEVIYAGSAPTLVSGLAQVNVRIPDTVDSGVQPVSVQVGGVASPPGVTVVLR